MIGGDCEVRPNAKRNKKQGKKNNKRKKLKEKRGGVTMKNMKYQIESDNRHTMQSIGLNYINNKLPVTQ